jgi:hypothetical protein
MAINTTPLALGTKSDDLFETIGQPLIGNTTSSGVTLLEGFGYLISTSEPTVTLADTDSDNIVSNSNIVTITATFSKSMAATPTISLSGIGSDLLMSATSSDSVWTYTWTVSTTVTSTTATVSGTDLSGNAYAGTDSLTFSIDNLGPTVVLSNNSLNNRVSNTQSVTLYATFSEELDITPTISLSGITTDAAMSNGNTIVLKPNNGWTSSSGSFQDFNGSSGSHPYLAEDLVIFSYLDNASIYKNFTISSGTVSVVVKLDYKKSYSEDTGQVKLYYYDANSTLLSTDASAVLTGTSDFQNLNFQSSVPSGAVVVRLELIQINESEFWAGNYGIRYGDLEIIGVDEGTVYGGNDTWSYTWTVSTTATSTTATVSATDNAGNSYTGSESMTFVIDNERPYAVSMTLSNNLKAGYISATDTNTLTITFNEEINASTFTASDVTILPSGYFSISEDTSSDNTIFIGYLNVLSNYAGVVTLTLNENSLEDLAGNANTVSSVSFISDYTVPTVTLTDTDSDNLVSNSEVVTLTATFSESMSATPTLSLSGIVSDAEMTATASASIWTYTWTVSTTATLATATVSGTDLSGNAYTGTESISFTIDNTAPEIKMNGSIGYTYVGYHNEHFYFINSGTSYGPELNWSNAKSAANDFLTSFTLSTQKAEGGLVVIDSSDENDFIGNYLNNTYSDNSVWTGIYQENDNSNWKNRLGQNQTYFSWRSDQPTGTNQNVVLFTADPSAQGSSFTSESNVWTDEEASNTNDYIVEIDNFYFEDNANSTKISLYSIMETLNWSLSGDDASFFEIDDSYTGTYAHTIFIDFKSQYKGTLNHSNPQDANSDNIYSVILSVSDVQSNTTSAVLNFKALDTTPPTVILTDTDSDKIVSNSDVVTLTATFSESMSATPTLSLTGIVSDAEMSATASASIWTYAWTVSTTLTSTTATISGTDLAGNAYSGTESITFNIDSSAPTIINTDSSDDDDYVKGGATVQLSVTFSEAVITPTITIGSDVSNASMTVSASTNSTTWYYDWAVPTGVDGTYVATVSTTDLIGNAYYSGTDSVTLTVDNTDPEISNVGINDDNDTITLRFTEPTFIADATSNSYTTTDTTYYLSVNQSGGTATITVDQIRYDSTTDDRVYYLDITVNGIPDGSEQISIVPSSPYVFKDRVENYAATTQSSNTLYLTNNPPKFTSTSVNSNNTSITIVFSEGVTDYPSKTDLSNTDFTLSVSGGTAVLASVTPSALSKTDSTTYVLSTSYTSPANGTEILTVTPISSAVFDSKGTQIVLSALSSNTVQLNDQKAPSITGATLDSQNRHVDIAFSEGIYGSSYAATAVTSSSFTLSQQSGPSYGMTISNITTTAGGVISGGETTLRFILAATVKPTGQEVFMITATDSTTVVDAMGNAMTVSQTNNSFQLKPPTSGGVSPEKSTIAVAPLELIGNGINTAIITVQAKDSIGQNFLEGGYSVTLFGPSGDLTSIDNQDGTYSAIYLAETPNQDSEQLTFGFRVAGTEGTATTMLTVYRDEDGDGVYNINDECPGTEAGSFVDEKGCALNQIDTDGDGVFDDIDECPDTPEFEINNVKGTPNYGELIPTVADEKGCGASQRDTDDDGIVDTEDNCIDTQNPDQADKDGDGIGDVCDTDNPIPQIESTELTFVQLPPSGLVIGKIKVTDPDGDPLSFTQTDSPFSGILSIDLRVMLE